MLKRFIVLTFMLSIGFLGTGLLTGCGQKGPLYLPTSIDEQVEGRTDTANSGLDKPVKKTYEEKTSTD